MCPFCEHRFMYNQNGREIIFYEYRDKETGKYYIDTVCPKCNEKMIVLEHELKGYFKFIENAHNGSVNTYSLWIVTMLIVVTILSFIFL